MLAWEIARQWQEANCMTPFEELLGAHLSCGLVHSTPEVFLLAQECHWTGTEMISRGDAEARRKELNAWFVELAAASPTVQQSNSPIAEFLRVATHPLPYVLWYRASRNRPHNLHAYKWDHLARRIGLQSLSPIT
jgi:hypothetical protein